MFEVVRSVCIFPRCDAAYDVPLCGSGDASEEETLCSGGTSATIEGQLFFCLGRLTRGHLWTHATI